MPFPLDTYYSLRKQHYTYSGFSVVKCNILTFGCGASHFKRDTIISRQLQANKIVQETHNGANQVQESDLFTFLLLMMHISNL